VVAGTAAASSIKAVAVLFGLAAALAYAAYTLRAPRGAVIVMFLALALVPVYALPSINAFSPQAGSLACLLLIVLLPAAQGRVRPVRFTAIDATFALTCIAVFVAAVFGPTHVLVTVATLLLWIPPYLVGRRVCIDRPGLRTFALGAVLAGCASLPFIAYETVTKHNVFFKLAIPGTTATKLWAKSAYRPGTGFFRTEAGFGHPLSMALIVSGCALLAFALALSAETRKWRFRWLGLGVVLVIAQYTSGERTGWVILVAAVVAFAASAFTRSTPIKYRLLLLAGTLVLVVAAFAAINDSGVTGAEAQSSHYRAALYAHALQPGVLKLLGLPESPNSNYNIFVSGISNVGFTSAVNGNQSIDSAYLQIGDQYGLIALFPMLAVLVAVVIAVVRCRGTPIAAVPATAFGVLLGLGTIGFQTQVPVFAWLVVGAASGAQLLATREKEAARRGGMRPPAAPARSELPVTVRSRVRRPALSARPAPPITSA